MMKIVRSKDEKDAPIIFVEIQAMVLGIPRLAKERKDLEDLKKMGWEVN